LKRSAEKKDQVIYTYDYHTFQKLQEEVRKSTYQTADWMMVWKHAAWIFKRPWNLEVLFNG